MSSAVGTTGVVQCHERTLIGSVGILNDAGGSSELPVGVYRVRVTRSWHDYEIGARAEGMLLDAADVQTARIAGLTGYGPEYQRDRYGDDSAQYRRAVSATAALDPARVFFALADFTADP